jgi:glycosyltransferase involved in cell wall biosynthesis
MNILFCSAAFTPIIGGVTTVAELLAERFHAFGHRVVLLTPTPAEAPDPEPYEIVRAPDTWTLLKLIRWADVVFHNNISLRLAWPQLLLRKKWVIAHHMWTPREGAGSWAGLLKHRASRFAHNIAVSQVMAESLDTPAAVIPNPYAEDVFVPLTNVPRDRDVVFLGRLVSGKGVPVLLDALAALAARGQRATLTIVGEGPDEPELRQRTESLGLAQQVRFAGWQQGVALVEILNAHRVMAVPSVWEEPFGVVALEGLACGCVPVVARSGGLPDAVGPCGLVVPKNDAVALADAIGRLVADDAARAALLARAPEHLARHTRDQIAQRYLEVIERVHRAA